MATSEKETNFRLYYNIDKEGIKNELYCTICGISMKLGQKVEEHPILKVALCRPCHLDYKAVNFNLNNLCIWCGEKNNTLRRCITCKAGFCKKCLSHNLDDKGKWEEKWHCLKCDAEPIWPLRNIFVKANIYSRKRSLSQEKVLSNQQSLRRFKRSKSIGCALSLEQNSLGNQIFKETSKKAKRPNYQTLQEFLRIIAKDLEHLFKESKNRIDDFKLDVFQTYTTQISQLQSWFSYLCLFIDSVTDNLDHFKNEVLKECTECKNYDGISLLSDYISKPKDNDRKGDTSPDSKVLPFSSSSQSSQDDPIPLQSTSQVKKNPQKKFELSLKKRKLIFSSDESSDEVESSNSYRKTLEDIQQKKENSNHQNTDVKKKTTNKFGDTETKDEAAILKELEDSNKKRQENRQESNCSESTEIYSPEFLTAQDLSSQLNDSRTTIIQPNYDGLEVCPETGNYIGGTVPDSSQSSNMELTDSDAQSFVFDIPDNLSKSQYRCDIASSEAQEIVEHVGTEKCQNENGIDDNNLETNTNEGKLLNIGEHEGEMNENDTDISCTFEKDKQQNVNSASVENSLENYVCEKDENQTVNENKADETNEEAEVSKIICDLKLDVSYSEDKFDIEEEKPREIDVITDEKHPVQKTAIEETKDNYVEEQINKILHTTLEYTNDLVNINVKKEYNDSTDEFEDLLSESDENGENTFDEERLKKALAHLQNDNIMMTDMNSRSASSLDVSSDDSFSDKDELNVVSLSKEQEKVVGRIVSLHLPELVVQKDSLTNSTDSDAEISVVNNVVEEEIGGKSTDNTPDILQNEHDGNGKSINKPFVLKSCCVLLDRLPKDFVLNKLREMRKEGDLEEAQLKRLLNLKNLDKKRRCFLSDEEKEKKRQINPVYKSKYSQQKETSSSSEADQFYEDSNEEGESQYSVPDKIEETKENKIQGYQGLQTLEEILRRQKDSRFLSSDSEDDSDDYDDEEQEENEKKKTYKKKLKKSKENEIEKDKNEQKKKTSSWRHDVLLRQRFEVPFDSEDYDSDEEKKIKKVSKKKQELNTNIGDHSDNEKSQPKRKRKKSSSSSFTTDDDKYIKIEKSDDEFHYRIPTKDFNSNKTIVLLSSSDSDVEFIMNSPVKNNAIPRKRSDKSESGKEEDSLKKKGRKNIRAIISDDVLEENTKKAIEEEKQRNIRVSQKQQLMSNFLSQSSENLEEEGLILDVDNETNKPLIVVNHNLSKRLKNHQSEGVKYMWSSCYESIEQIKHGNEGSGCILAHCMGLGKTFQVITLIHTLFKYQEETRTKRVLVVCPLSTVLNWENEFKIAFNIASNSKEPVVYILGDHNNSTFSKACKIKLWYDQGGILVIGYEAYSAALKTMKYSQNMQDKVNAALVDPGPDLVILDEGHLLKNGKTSRTTTLMQIKTKRRIILTGTPMQNNLREYYYMVNFVKPNLLGSLLEYNNRFVNPIVNGQYDDSTEEDVRKMKYLSHVLNKMLKRTIQRFEVSELEMYLPPKLDFVLFVRLHPVQVQLYQAFLECLNVDVILAGRLFAHYRYLQNVWTHPYLLILQDKMKNVAKDKNIKEIDTIDLDPEITVVEQKPVVSNWWSWIIPQDVEKNIEYGPKFCIMLSIIEEAICCGDKVVVFANSLNELDGIEHFLKLIGTPSCRRWRNKIEYYRMDGTIKPDSRMSLCMSFNNPKNTQTKLFLVSHKVGGLGLNLVAANRVILMDVNWNPSYDSQSVFRTYRFGQKKTCYVYRLVSMGTMEEVVYERSVTKLAIAERVIDERQINRHYRSDDLQKMYRANFDLNQPRPNLNVPEDIVLGKVYQKHTKELFKYHSHQSLLENVPHECLTEEEMERAWLEFGKENEEAARKLEINKQIMENAKKKFNEIRYQKNIETINALAEDATNKNIILNNCTIAKNENFVNILNTSMLPAACHAFAKENEKNLKDFISNEMTRAGIAPSTNNGTGASRNSSTQLGHFEEVYVPIRHVDVDVNDNRDNDVILLEEHPFNDPSCASVDNNRSSEDPKTNGRLIPARSLLNKDRFPPTNCKNINLLRKRRVMRLVPRSTSIEIPQEVIDVENHSLLAMLAKNHDISVSQILKPKTSEM